MVAFPLNPDILEIVFSHLDGRSLWSCSLVCTLWKDIVDRITGTTNVWKMCCLEEMDADVRHEIQTNLFPDLWSSASKEDNEKWRTVYKCWIRWKNTKTWYHISRSTWSTHLRSETVNCLKVSGSCILTGHELGVVLVWDYVIGLLGILTKHIASVTSLDVIAVPGMKKGRIKGNQVNHDYVISTSLDRTTYLYPLRLEAYPRITIAKHHTPVTSISVFHNKFVVAEENVLSVWKLLPSSSESKERFYQCVFKHEENSVSLSVVKMCEQCVAGLTLCNRMYALGWEKNQIPRRFYTKAEDRFCESSTYIVKKYFWRRWIFAWITSHHFLYVTVDDKIVQYNTMPDLHSYPTALCLYGSVFLIGTDSGNVYMYVIESPEDLLHLKFSAYRWSCSLSSVPVIHLDISDDALQPVVVAATGTSMHYASLQTRK